MMADATIRRPGRTRVGQPPPLATPEAVEWTAGLLAQGWAAVFLPQQPARHGRLLTWRPAHVRLPQGDEPPAGVEADAAELGPPARSWRAPPYGARWAVPVAVAVPALLTACPA